MKSQSVLRRIFRKLRKNSEKFCLNFQSFKTKTKKEKKNAKNLKSSKSLKASNPNLTSSWQKPFHKQFNLLPIRGKVNISFENHNPRLKLFSLTFIFHSCFNWFCRFSELFIFSFPPPLIFPSILSSRVVLFFMTRGRNSKKNCLQLFLCLAFHKVCSRGKKDKRRSGKNVASWNETMEKVFSSIRQLFCCCRIIFFLFVSFWKSGNLIYNDDDESRLLSASKILQREFSSSNFFPENRRFLFFFLFLIAADYF